MTRLSRLTVTNFMQVEKFDEDLAPLVLIAGPNGSGKSSLRDGLDLCLTGNPGRAGVKKQMHELVRRGAPSSTVGVVTSDGEVIERDVASGRLRGADPQLPSAMPFVLRADEFARKLTPAERRTFIYGLMGVSTKPEEVTKRLKARNIDQALIDRILPYLAGGFAPALSEAESHRAKSKAAWEEVTGDRYGSKKAEAWVKDAAAFDPAELQQATEDTEGWQAEIERLNRLVGRLNEVRRARAQIPDLREQAKGFAKAAEDENLHQVELDRLKAALASLVVPAPAKAPEEAPEGGADMFNQEELAPVGIPARQQAPAASSGVSTQGGRGPSGAGSTASKPAPLSCPKCDTKLTIFNGKLILNGAHGNG